jgi:hypothetical protein
LLLQLPGIIDIGREEEVEGRAVGDLLEKVAGRTVGDFDVDIGVAAEKMAMRESMANFRSAAAAITTSEGGDVRRIADAVARLAGWRDSSVRPFPSKASNDGAAAQSSQKEPRAVLIV